MDMFGVSAPPPDPRDATAMQCLMNGALGGECVAGYLNARYFGQSVYGYSDTQIVSMVRNGLLSDPGGLHGTLQYLNNNMEGTNPYLSGIV